MAETAKEKGAVMTRSPSPTPAAGVARPNVGGEALRELGDARADAEVGGLEHLGNRCEIKGGHGDLYQIRSLIWAKMVSRTLRVSISTSGAYSGDGGSRWL